MTINQIFVVAANSAPWWSFSSLWDSLRALQWAAAISAAILTIGAVIEYWAKLKLLTLLIGKWLLRRSTPFERCAFNKIVAHSLGPILVTVGIAGDFIFEGRAFILEDRQEEQSQRLIGSLSEKATSAEAKADAATLKATALDKEEGAIQKRLDTASGQLDTIESQLRVQGPRRKLLEDNRDKFIQALRPFAGQRVTVLKCGPAIVAEPEQLEQYLLNLLGISKASKPNAGWAVESPGYAVWATCNTGASSAGGNLVITSANATGPVKSAAEALYDALNAIDISTIKAEAPDDQRARTFFAAEIGADSPWAMAAKDPSAVIILIGSNPMFDLSGWHNRHKRKKRATGS
jgi:hypothetical protein